MGPDIVQAGFSGVPKTGSTKKFYFSNVKIFHVAIAETKGAVAYSFRGSI